MGEVNALIAKSMDDAQCVSDAKETATTKYASKGGHIAFIHPFSLA
jgi:hypothetical protein